MVRTYERSCPALTQHAKTSESTILGSHSVGTLHDGTYVDTTCPTNQLSILTTVSTHSTKRSSITYSAIPTTSSMSIDTTVSTGTTMLTHAVDLSLSHARPALHTLVKHQRRTTMRPPEFMASISIHTGKKIVIITITTIKRSTGSLFPDPSVSQPSRKSLTLRDVTLYHCRWLPLCINRPTTIGFGSWLTVVKYI